MAAPQERWECPNCGTPLNIAALGIYAKVACPACGHIDHVHTMLANYRIESVLGLGGMSVVLRARDLVLERPLAIKLLNEFYRDHPERMARFEQECELMAKVRHENVVSVYSAGRVKGQFYIAMELINGRNLEEIVRDEGPLPPLRALDILRQVVQGLAAAHKAGLLHRDMKPGNILICEDGRAKVLDFGLSLGKRDEDTEEIIWATPYYVPPETLMRHAEDVRTDIYALGMTLRHLLTGQENFDPLPAGIDEMLACKKALPPMAEVLPSLPEAYCDLVDHMTAYDSANRPESYASLLVEIAEVRAALKAERRGAPLAQRLRRALPLLTGAAVTLVMGGAAAAVTARLATPEPELLYATPAADLPWVERDTLAAAMEQLSSGNTKEAAALLNKLANSEGEPTACAWAALHAAMLACLLGEEEPELSRLRERVAHHLSRPPVSAGEAMHRQMAALSAGDSAPDNPFLQAHVTLTRMQSALAACKEQEWAQQLRSARAALRGAGSAYAPMAELSSAYEKRLAAALGERAQRHCVHSLARLDMAEATRAFALLESATTDEFSKGCLSVRREALALFSEAVEMMRRRALMPVEGIVVTPQKLPELLTGLNAPTLAAELATLMLVAQGELEAAAAHNPYAKLPESPEPFAVMMRDWLERTSAR